MRRLHDWSIVHRDISLENILLEKSADKNAPLLVRIIDFGRASTERFFSGSVRGKPSYQAPEQHTNPDVETDGFLSDSFALGVVVYCLVLRDYPWLSTKPGGCKCFEFVRTYGFTSFLAKRQRRNSSERVERCMSGPLKALLGGLLSVDPAERFTLGESAFDLGFGPTRRPIWDEPWMRNGPG